MSIKSLVRTRQGWRQRPRDVICLSFSVNRILRPFPAFPGWLGFSSPTCMSSLYNRELALHVMSYNSFPILTLLTIYFWHWVIFYFYKVKFMNVFFLFVFGLRFFKSCFKRSSHAKVKRNYYLIPFYFPSFVSSHPSSLLRFEVHHGTGSQVTPSSRKLDWSRCEKRGLDPWQLLSLQSHRSEPAHFLMSWDFRQMVLTYPVLNPLLYKVEKALPA